MIHYKAIRETLTHPEIGRYVSYGIAGYGDDGQLRCLVPDVCPDAGEGAAFAAQCTQEQVEPMQLMDVIEDHIGVPCV